MDWQPAAVGRAILCLLGPTADLLFLWPYLQTRLVAFYPREDPLQYRRRRRHRHRPHPLCPSRGLVEGLLDPARRRPVYWLVSQVGWEKLADLH